MPTFKITLLERVSNERSAKTSNVLDLYGIAGQFGFIVEYQPITIRGFEALIKTTKSELLEVLSDTLITEVVKSPSNTPYTRIEITEYFPNGYESEDGLDVEKLIVEVLMAEINNRQNYFSWLSIEEIQEKLNNIKQYD